MNDERLERDLLVALSAAGYLRAHGPELAPGGAAPERSDLRQVVLVQRLRRAIRKLNAALPQAAREGVLQRVLTPGAAEADFLRMLIDGVALQADGETALLIDRARPGRNEWLAVSRFAVPGPGGNRTLDIVLFVNGLPLVAIDLQGPAARETDRWALTRSGRGGELQPYGGWRVARDAEAKPADAPSAGLQALVRGCLAPKPLLDALGAWNPADRSPAPK